jgi:glyoxylase-like metal-dependent hydrolase (beta-lactamase superfamily II)
MGQSCPILSAACCLAVTLGVVFLASFPAGPWQTNCYVAATAAGTECVIIDPGMDSISGIADLVADHRLKPVAVMLTHGHLDHMFSVVGVCSSYATACWVHPDDRELLADPLRGMSGDTAALLRQLAPTTTFAEPDDVRELVDGAVVDVAGLSFAAIHAPGHTPGSLMFRSPAGTGDDVVFSGDVLFAGSIGRTDLPGGDPAAMRTSLRTKVQTLPDSVVVLPGHGEQTTIGRERASNPYLSAAYLSRSNE